MPRVPIDLVVDWLDAYGSFGNPVGYMSEESGARFDRQGATNDQFVLKNTRLDYYIQPERLCCVLLFEMTLRKRRTHLVAGVPTLGEEEVEVFGFDWFIPFPFYRTGVLHTTFLGYENPFTFLTPFVTEDEQTRTSDGRYVLRSWRLKATGHKIPFKLYYRVNRVQLVPPGDPSPEPTADEVQHITFNRDVGWEQPFGWEVNMDESSWLTDFRVAPLPA